MWMSVSVVPACVFVRGVRAALCVDVCVCLCLYVPACVFVRGVRAALCVDVCVRYYNWATAAPMVLCEMAFNKPLPEVRWDGLVLAWSVYTPVWGSVLSCLGQCTCLFGAVYSCLGQCTVLFGAVYIVLFGAVHSIVWDSVLLFRVGGCTHVWGSVLIWGSVLLFGVMYYLV